MPKTSPPIVDCCSCTIFMNENSGFLHDIANSSSNDMVCTTTQTNGYCDQFSGDDVKSCVTLCNNVPLVNNRANNFWSISRMFDPTNPFDTAHAIQTVTDPNIVCQSFGECPLSPVPECNLSCQMVGAAYGSNFCPSNNEVGGTQDITSNCFFSCWMPNLIKFKPIKDNQELYDRYIIFSYLTDNGKQFFDNNIAKITSIETDIYNNLLTTDVNNLPQAFSFFTLYISKIQQAINYTFSSSCSGGDIQQQVLFIQGFITALDPSFNAQICTQQLNIIAGMWNDFLSAFKTALQDNLRSAICVIINKFIKILLPEIARSVGVCGAIKIPKILGQIIAVLANAESLFSVLQTNIVKMAYLLTLAGSLYNGCINPGPGLTLTQDAGYILGIACNCLIGTCNLINNTNMIQANETFFAGQMLVTQNDYNLIMDYDGYLKIRKHIDVTWQFGASGGIALKLDATGANIISNSGVIASICPGITNPFSMSIFPNGYLVLSDSDGVQVWNNTMGCSGHGTINWNGSACACKCDPHWADPVCNSCSSGWGPPGDCSKQEIECCGSCGGVSDEPVCGSCITTFDESDCHGPCDQCNPEP